MSLALSLNAQNVDRDTQEQINPAKKQAEKMGVKMPDIDKMMQESTELCDLTLELDAAGGSNSKATVPTSNRLLAAARESNFTLRTRAARRPNSE
jgi:hypothetical protein